MSSVPASRLIVNADDLGRTRGINSGIFESHTQGILTSATLMVIYPAAQEAAAELPNLPELGVGLHVQLSGGRPLLPAERIPTLVDETGRFPAKPEGHGALRYEEVLAEVEAQLARFRDLTGRRPTHLDSHHHSHRLSVICQVLVEIARREGLPVRRASLQVASRLAEADIATSDRFVERFFAESARLDVLLGLVEDLGPGVTELMCHPAHVDEELRRDSSYSEDRERELAVLTSPEVQALVTRRGIELIHFGDL